MCLLIRKVIKRLAACYTIDNGTFVNKRSYSAFSNLGKAINHKNITAYPKTKPRVSV